MRKDLTPLPGAHECPCSSGKTYRQCCAKKRIRYRMDADGRVHTAVKLHPEALDALENQLSDFPERFGRKPGNRDFIFNLRYLSSQQDYWHEIRQIFGRAGIDHELAFAYQKTGRIITQENAKLVPDNALEEWQEAIDEYREAVVDGEDPFLSLDGLSAGDVHVYAQCSDDLVSSIIHWGSYLEKIASRASDNHTIASFLLCASIFNTLKFIRRVMEDIRSREILASCRNIYEAYLRLRYMRLRATGADDMMAQALVGDGNFEYKPLPDYPDASAGVMLR